MAYLTQAELEDRIGADHVAALSDHSGAHTADTSVVDSAIADADAEANGYIGVLHALPLSTPPEQVKSIVAAIARYNLHRRNVPADHPAYIAYRDAVRTLERIASGDVVLSGVALPVVASSGGFAATTPYYGFSTGGLLD